MFFNTVHLPLSLLYKQKRILLDLFLILCQAGTSSRLGRVGRQKETRWISSRGRILKWNILQPS